MNSPINPFCVSWGSGTCSTSLSYSVFAKIANADINIWIKTQITKLLPKVRLIQCI